MDLVIRPWAEDDAPALSRAIAESLDHLRPWMPWAAGEPRGEDFRRAWIRETVRGEDAVFGMWLGDRVVGGCGLHRRIAAGGLELGYWVHAAFTRRGIATETVLRLCAIGFADPAIEVLEIHHDPRNVASGRVAAAAGFALVSEDADECVWRTFRPR